MKQTVIVAETSVEDSKEKITELKGNVMAMEARMKTLEDLLAAKKGIQQESQAKRMKESEEIPDHQQETRWLKSAESQGEPTQEGTLTKAVETPSIQMTSVPMFLQNPGKPYVEFSTWFESFTTYLEASKLTGVDEPRKASILRHCLGTEGFSCSERVQSPSKRWRK